MKSLYDMLEINKDASPLEIKKAYFKMVRKYPPERSPEKFMEIRKAYETLSNAKTKEEYDSRENMPHFIKINYERAQTLMEYGDYKKAIAMLEEISKYFPQMLIVRNLLGEAYFANGNTGKAISLYEQLVKEAPDNASFSGGLAHAYLSRGWHKKAIDAYLKAIELDEDNISLWLGLADAYVDNKDMESAKKTLERSLEHENDENREVFGPIYFKLALSDIKNNDIDSFKTRLDKMLKVVNEFEEGKEDAGLALLNISYLLVDSGLYNMAKESLKNAEILLPKNKEVLKLKKENEHFLELDTELPDFDEDNYDDDFKEIIFDKLFPEDEYDDDPEKTKVIELITEYEFLVEIDSYRGQINSLKENYPIIYSKVKEFLIQAMNPKLNRRMIQQYEKQLGKKRKVIEKIMQESAFDLDEYDEDYYEEIQQPIRRQEPKVGRNDPCPCGSGKKYKKCCGNK